MAGFAACESVSCTLDFAWLRIFPSVTSIFVQPQSSLRAGALRDAGALKALPHVRCSTVQLQCARKEEHSHKKPGGAMGSPEWKPKIFEPTFPSAWMLEKRRCWNPPPWSVTSNGCRRFLVLMAVCKSRTRAFMAAFPSSRSQKPSLYRNSHYAPQTQQESHPDRPIGYGAFGVVW